MAVAAYYSWNKAGRPLTPAVPIREIVEQLKVAYPRGAKLHLFSWYADEAHYTAEPPEDHTPYSATGWPNANPYPYVHATDVMHRPDLGVDCFPLFDYWISEARAGRMPWLKYLVWQGRRYHARDGFAAKPAGGHFDHVHISTRTDHTNTSLGTWSVVPGGEDHDMTPDESAKLSALAFRVDAITYGLDDVRGGEYAGEDMWIVREMKTVAADIAELKSRPSATVDVAALAAALVADPGFQAALKTAAFEGAQEAEQK